MLLLQALAVCWLGLVIGHLGMMSRNARISLQGISGFILIVRQQIWASLLEALATTGGPHSVQAFDFSLV